MLLEWIIQNYLNFRILVQHRARLDSRNAMMQTPLFLAAQNNHVDIVKYLVKK